MTSIFFVQFIIKQLLDSVFAISRIIKGLGKGYQPRLFWISQKPHPIRGVATCTQIRNCVPENNNKKINK